MKIPYKHFSNYVLRTPLLPLNIYHSLTNHKEINENELRKIYQNSTVREAIFLASPELYSELNKWAENKIVDKKRKEKLKLTLLKYISRMSSRCTPFGLFAGCSVGEFSTKNDIQLNEIGQNKRHTTLDMNYLVALSQKLAQIPKIKEQILFFPNSSLYKLGNRIRYVEYGYINGRRKHHTAELESNYYLEKLLDKSKGGASLSNLAREILEENITYGQAYGFVEELVDNQILISNLEPSVSGPEFLEQICEVLEPLTGVDEIYFKINNAKKKLSKIDRTLGNPASIYYQLHEDIKELLENYDIKYMFQTDMYFDPEVNTLNEKIIKEIKKGLILLNKATESKTDNILKFSEHFKDRYGGREISLAKALDVETGINYKSQDNSGDYSPLIDDIIFPPKDKDNHNLRISTASSIIRQKFSKALIESSYTMKITEGEFAEYIADWEDLPDTFSCLIELIHIDGEEKIKLKGFGGASAANLLSRFCHGNNKIHKHTLNIIQTEENISKNIALAEIVHLPESRVGNILLHPNFRNYEIPYLAKSMESRRALEIEDLMVSVKEKGKVRLRSKTINKEILPRLTNSHNFSQDSLPVYQFLCDMQTQGIRSGLNLPIGWLAEERGFFPRIEYDNIIFREATWNFSKDDIVVLQKSKENLKVLLISVNTFRKKFSIPQYITLVDRDNELLVNMENMDSLKMFLQVISKRTEFTIKEFLFDKNCVVKNGENYYTNQVVVSFYNEYKLKKDK